MQVVHVFGQYYIVLLLEKNGPCNTLSTHLHIELISSLSQFPNRFLQDLCSQTDRNFK